MKQVFVASLFASLLVLASGATLDANATDFEPERSGISATLPPIGEHWVWIPDRLLQHNFLFDAGTGEMLATIPGTSTLTPQLPLVSKMRQEIYSVDLDYSRGTRGKRIDYVTIYDAETLAVKGEVILPHPTSESNTSLHHAALLDGDRFLVIFSQFPITVATIVDLELRRVVSEVSLAGCAGVYAAGPTRFATLCGDGTVSMSVLDRDGKFGRLERSVPFFNVIKDPVSMAGVRFDDSWFFISFLGLVHEVDFSSDRPAVKTAWSLTDDRERKDDWRPGGLQPFALHRSLNRLYALMQQGGPGSHKDASPEIWVYDLENHARIARFEIPNLAAHFVGQLMELEEGSYAVRILRLLIPNQGAHAVAITQDANPLLITRHGKLGAIAILDGRSGETIRVINEVGFTGPTLGVP